MNAHTADRFDNDAAFRENVQRTATQRVQADPNFIIDARPILLQLRAEKFVESEKWTIVEEATWRLLNAKKWRVIYDWHVHRIADAFDSNMPGGRFCSRCDRIHGGPIDRDCRVFRLTQNTLRRRRDTADLKEQQKAGHSKSGRPRKWANDAQRKREERDEKVKSLKDKDLTRINGQTPISDQPHVDTSNEDPRYWDDILAQSGLYEANAFATETRRRNADIGRGTGSFITDAPKGGGKLVSGGYDAAKILQVNTAHGLTAGFLGKKEQGTQNGGRRVRPKGQGPDDDEPREES